MKRILLAASALAAAVALLAVASALAGKPAPATLTISPNTAQDFGTVDPGYTNTIGFEVTYTGKASSGPLRLILGSWETGLSIPADTNNCSAVSLRDGGSCTFEVEYAPTEFSQTDNTDLTVLGRKVESVSVDLTGASTAAVCTAGSEDFSGYADFELTFDFSGGRIYVPFDNGYIGIRIEPDSWGSNGQFPDGTHLYYTGVGANSAELTFDAAIGYAPVGWVQLDVQSAAYPGTADTTETLTAYDSSDSVIDTDSATSHNLKNTLSVQSSSNNIDHFTIETNDPDARGFGFTNISWGCVPL